MHRRNSSEWAVTKFKNHFIVDLLNVDPSLTFYLWDRLLPQVTMTLNMLQQYQLNPVLSVYEQVDGNTQFLMHIVSTIRL